MDKHRDLQTKYNLKGSEREQGGGIPELSPLFDTLKHKLQSEHWKDIPDFEGLYKISNYGRVQSLPRWVFSENRATYFRDGRFIKLRLTKTAESRKFSPTVDVQVKLHRDGNRYFLSVARIVYYLFVAKFDMEDHAVIIRRKDGNKLNCHYQNLVLVSISDVAKEGFSTKLRKSVFQEQSKPVSQYTLKGKLLNNYNTAGEASAATSIPAQYINDAARRKQRIAGGYYWRYGKPYANINVSKLKNSLQHALSNTKKQIQQLSMDGKPLKIYESVSKAAKAMNVASCSNISYACKGKYYSSKGYRWRYVNS